MTEIQEGSALWHLQQAREILDFSEKMSPALRLDEKRLMVDQARLHFDIYDALRVTLP